MAWQIFAIAVIIIATMIWFVRDERQMREQRLQERAQHFALAPAYRHQVPQRTLDPVLVGRAGTDKRRRFLSALQR